MRGRVDNEARANPSFRIWFLSVPFHFPFSDFDLALLKPLWQLFTRMENNLRQDVTKPGILLPLHRALTELFFVTENRVTVSPSSSVRLGTISLSRALNKKERKGNVFKDTVGLLQPKIMLFCRENQLHLWSCVITWGSCGVNLF